MIRTAVAGKLRFNVQRRHSKAFLMLVPRARFQGYIRELYRQTIFKGWICKHPPARTLHAVGVGTGRLFPASWCGEI